VRSEVGCGNADEVLASGQTRGGQKKRPSFSMSQVKIDHLFDLSRRRNSDFL
jgi:hypothetical protein